MFSVRTSNCSLLIFLYPSTVKVPLPDTGDRFLSNVILFLLSFILLLLLVTITGCESKLSLLTKITVKVFFYLLKYHDFLQVLREVLMEIFYYNRQCPCFRHLPTH